MQGTIEIAHFIAQLAELWYFDLHYSILIQHSTIFLQFDNIVIIEYTVFLIYLNRLYNSIEEGNWTVHSNGIKFLDNS